MCCVETKVRIDNAVTVSRKIGSSWSWIFNFEYHDNGRIFVDRTFPFGIFQFILSQPNMLLVL